MQGPRIATASFARALLMLGGARGLRAAPLRPDRRRDQPEPATIPPSTCMSSRSRRRSRPRHARTTALGFGAGFVNAGMVSPDTIRPGDTLSVAVWENVDTGLLVGVGQKATTLQAIQVDQSGDIFVPYAGRLQAAGRTPDQLRQRYHRQPRGTDARPAGRGAPGRRRRRDRQRHGRRGRAGGLSDRGADAAALGDAGAGRRRRSWCPTWRRSRSSATARSAASGCRISTTTPATTSRCAAATASSSRRTAAPSPPSAPPPASRGSPFNKRDISVIEAIATVGGLDGRTANPSGVFVFRDEPAAVANRVLGARRPRRHAADRLPA